ncbi:MAG: glycoside hydrolase family 88 protein [Prevotella sp.]|nr:glycoside hydrolase family 88 protein [Prevotella sp.]
MILLAIMAVVSSVSYAATNLSLRFTADDAGDITSSKTIGAFTIIPGSKTTTIEAGSASVSEETFTHRVKFGGGASTSGMYISFEVSGPCVIKAYGASGGSSTRSLKITCGDTWGATTLATICSSTSTSNVVAEEYNYTGSANTIYIGSAGSGYYVYGIDVTYSEGGSTETRYTVSFNANTNGTCSTSSLTEASEGAGVTLPTATANYGYNFLGWSTNSTATTASYSAGATYKPSANTTLYAIYEVDANAPALPAAGSAITFDATKRYSEWVINSRLSDFYGNEKVMNFATYTNDGTKTTSGKSTSLDYVPGLVAKAVLETIDYYKNNTEINVKPWFYAVQDYANNTIPSKGKNGQSFDDLNAVKLYFKLKELAQTGIFPDATDTNISNSKSISTANTRFAEALHGIDLANTSYSISESLLPDAAGGWFHKSDYTNQMWCDGQYMGPALLAQMLNEYSDYTPITGSKSADWDLVTKQFTISWNYLWNPEVKLLYHAFTADPAGSAASSWYGISSTPGNEIYHSAEYWGRAEGWYFLALVDVLEQMQIAGLTKTQNYKTLHGYLNELAAGIAAKQDAATGCWYQLLNHDGTFVAQSYSGSSYTSNPVANYLESSASAIFTAAYLKGMRLGLYDTDYTAIAKKAYQGIVEQFMVADGNGGVHLVCCSKSAGLGGSSNRDGSAEYYLMGEDTEPTSKDPNAKTHDNKAIFYTEGKVFGGFILAATEYERLFIDKKLELTDAGEYTTFPESDFSEVKLTRNIPAGEWNTLVLPFDVTATQISETFANGSVVAVLQQLDADKMYVKTQSYINANEPVFIKIEEKSSDDTYTFKDVTVKNGTATSAAGGVQMIGTYALLTGGANGDLGASDYFIYDNKFYDCTYLNQMKPFRAYVTSTGAQAKMYSIKFMEEEEADGVQNVKAVAMNDDAPIYNIIGQRVTNGAKGLLLQNHRKIAVK